MNDRFKITIELDQIVELVVRIPFKAYDQRENYSYTDYKIETKKFASVQDARQWVSENSYVQVKSAAQVTNITDEFN